MQDDDIHASHIESEQHSYEEVADVISNKDDPSTVCLTFRSIFLGFFLKSIQSLFNAYFVFYRTVGIQIDSFLLQLFAYLLGKFLAVILPSRRFTRWRLTLNPGPFTIKEHVLITMMIVAGNPLRPLEQLDVQRFVTEKSMHTAAALVYTISVQLLGFGLAGILRRFLVWPSSILWPSILPSLITFRIMHEQDAKDVHTRSGKISRLTFFVLASIGQFAYSWLPLFIMPVLRSFSWICMIVSKNRIFAQLTSTNGFAMGSLTFSWIDMNMYLSSPIVVPGWVHVNVAIGFLLLVWLIGPLIFYLDLWNAHSLPIRSTIYYYLDNNKYNLYKAKVSPDLLNTTAYTQHNRAIYVSTVQIIEFATGFALLPALFVHTILYHGKWLLKQARNSFNNRNNDIHCKLMSAYEETPDWWFFLLFLGALITVTFYCHFSNLMPAYYVLLSIFISCITTLPFGLLAAQTALSNGLSSVFAFQLLGVLLFTSNPVGYNTFIDLAMFVQNQGIVFLVYLKVSHYMKLPPRIVFGAVIASTIYSSFLTTYTLDYIFTHTPNICDENSEKWRCSKTRIARADAVYLTFFPPHLLFSRESGIYYPLMWFVLIGALLPIPFWLLAHRFPKNQHIQHIHIPIILSVGTYWSTQWPSSIFSWFLVGLICSFVLRRWWYRRYGIVLSSALDVGASLTNTFVYFLAVEQRIRFPTWWGTGRPKGDGCFPHAM